MKKLILAIMLVLFMSATSFAAWTTWTVEYKSAYAWANKQEAILLKLTCESDGGSSGDLTLSEGLITTHNAGEATAYMNKIRGGILLAVEYVPDATDVPASTATFTIDTADGTNIFSEAVTTANTNQVFNGKADLGFNMPLTDLIFASTTLGNGDKAVFYVWIIR